MSGNKVERSNLTHDCTGVSPWHTDSRFNPQPANNIPLSENTFKLGSVCEFCASKSRCPAASLMLAIPENHQQLLFHSHSIGAGKHIFHSGDPLQAIYVLKSGSLKSYMPGSGNIDHVIGFDMPGNVLGIDAIANGCHDSSAVALEQSTYCAAPAKQIKSLVKKYYPEWLSILASEALVREQHNMQMMNQRDSKSRIAAFLINLSKRFSSRGYSQREFSLSMPREDLGNHLGLAMETVSRTLSRLQTDKIINVERRKVTILDMARLKDSLG